MFHAAVQVARAGGTAYLIAPSGLLEEQRIALHAVAHHHRSHRPLVPPAGDEATTRVMLDDLRVQHPAASVLRAIQIIYVSDGATLMDNLAHWLLLPRHESSRAPPDVLLVLEADLIVADEDAPSTLLSGIAATLAHAARFSAWKAQGGRPATHLGAVSETIPSAGFASGAQLDDDDDDDAESSAKRARLDVDQHDDLASESGDMSDDSDSIISMLEEPVDSTPSDTTLPLLAASSREWRGCRLVTSVGGRADSPLSTCLARWLQTQVELCPSQIPVDEAPEAGASLTSSLLSDTTQISQTQIGAARTAERRTASAEHWDLVVRRRNADNSDADVPVAARLTVLSDCFVARAADE